MTDYKIHEMSDRSRGSALRKYRALYYGDMPGWRALICEVLFSVLGGMPGALGLFLRAQLYPWVFAQVGPGTVFGRHMTIRHPHRIRLGAGVILDDYSVIDAKGETNEGISLGDGVYVGRHTIIYCKNGNIRIGQRVNISSNCQLVSSNDMTIGAFCVIGAYAYLLSGGGYDYTMGAPRFSDQNGFITKGPLVVGENCWLGAGIVVMDAASVGEHCVVAAGAVVTQPVPAHTMVGGVPARVIKSIGA